MTSPEDENETTPYLRPEDILEATASAIDQDAYPNEFAAGATRLPLTYHFRPGTEEDGIHLTIHPAALPQVSDDVLEWLVPGQLEPKVIAMIKSLPKRLRRLLVPAADVAKRVTDDIVAQRGASAFMPTLCQTLTRYAETRIGPQDFQADKLDPHWKFLIQVVDDSGKVLASDRSIDSIKQTLGTIADSADSAGSEKADNENWHRDRMTTWDIELLPREVVRQRGGVHVAQYPAMVDEGDGVSTRLFADERLAEASSRLGLTRLFAIACRKDLRTQVRHLPAIADAKMKLSGLISSSAMESSLADLLARLAVVEKRPIIRTPDEYQERFKEAPGRIGEATQDVAVWLSKLTQSYHAMRVVWEDTGSPKFAGVRENVMRQLEWLFADGFISWTPWEHLQHFPRYVDAIAYRLDKLRSGSIEKDGQSQEIVETLWYRWMQTRPDSEAGPRENTDSEFRWMIEELRVSQFAQPLGTAYKVSPKRCEKLLEKNQ